MVSNQGPIARARQLEAENKRLRDEQTESARHIAELRKIVADFDQQLGDAKLGFAQMAELRSALTQSQEQAARFEREAGILTRALAVHAVEADIDGEAALMHASAEWDVDQLSAELDRLRDIEDVYEKCRNENEELKKKTSEFDAVQVQLVQERAERDKLARECDKLNSRADTYVQERRGLTEQIQELETRLRIVSVGKTDEEQKNYALSRKSETIEAELVEIRNKERVLTSNMAQLEAKLAGAVNEGANACRELEMEKSEKFHLQEELKRMHASLNAEADASASLALRLDKLESEKDKIGADCGKLRQKNAQLESTVSELQQIQLANETMRKEIFELRNICDEKDEKIAQLVASRDVQKNCATAEIQRLNGQLDSVVQKANELGLKYSRISKEKDKIKSLLAKDTMSRLSRVLATNPNDSRWSVNSFSYN